MASERTLKTIDDEENLFRIHLKEEFVDSGFIDVHQWRNFSDYFRIELDKARQDERKKTFDEIIGFFKSSNLKKDFYKLLRECYDNGYNEGMKKKRIENKFEKETKK